MILHLPDTFYTPAALDAPFSGSIEPRHCYRSDPAVRSVMVEVRRDLFTDERSGGKLPAFDSFRDALQDVVKALGGTR